MIGRVRMSCAAMMLFCLPAAALAAPAKTADDASSRKVERIQLAQQQSDGGHSRMSIPQPSQRRTGELEGWSGPTDKKTAPEGRQKTAAGRKGKAPAAAQSNAGAQERDPEDGGLPLPSTRAKDNNAPVSFDGQKIGTGLKF